jgi:hypothetical protein
MVVLTGRTVLQKATGYEALNGVRVRILSIWRQMPSPYEIIPSADPRLVFITPPLVFDRSAKDGQLHWYELHDLEDAGRTLLENVEPGSKSLHASNCRELDPEDLLALDYVDAERVEILSIEAVATMSESQSGTLEFTGPLQRAHRSGAPLEKVRRPDRRGVQHRLKEDARAGESCLFLDQLKNLETAHYVSISDNTENPPEYHMVKLYEAKSNNQGYYRLPPLSRVAQVELQANYEELKPVNVVFSPDYRQTENRVDFSFSTKAGGRNA